MAVRVSGDWDESRMGLWRHGSVAAGTGRTYRHGRELRPPEQEREPRQRAPSARAGEGAAAAPPGEVGSAGEVR